MDARLTAALQYNLCAVRIGASGTISVTNYDLTIQTLFQGADLGEGHYAIGDQLENRASSCRSIRSGEGLVGGRRAPAKDGVLGVISTAGIGFERDLPVWRELLSWWRCRTCSGQRRQSAEKFVRRCAVRVFGGWACRSGLGSGADGGALSGCSFYRIDLDGDGHGRDVRPGGILFRSVGMRRSIGLRRIRRRSRMPRRLTRSILRRRRISSNPRSLLALRQGCGRDGPSGDGRRAFAFAAP